MFGLLYTIFMGFWRDAFGKDGHNLPVLKNRMALHTIAFVITFLLCFFVKGFAWHWSLWVALWIQIYWALGHGPCYDTGTAGKPDDKLLKRYEKMLGYKLVCRLFPKEEWYGFGFDFVLLAIRYTYPLLPIFFLFNPVLLTLGLLVAGLYAMYRYCEYFRKHRLLDVEIWAGLVTGLFVAFL